MFEFWLNDEYLYLMIIDEDHSNEYENFLKFEKYIKENGILFYNNPDNEIYVADVNEENKLIGTKFSVDSEDKIFYIKLKYGNFIHNIEKI